MHLLDASRRASPPRAGRRCVAGPTRSPRRGRSPPGADDRVAAAERRERRERLQARPRAGRAPRAAARAGGAAPPEAARPVARAGCGRARAAREAPARAVDASTRGRRRAREGRARRALLPRSGVAARASAARSQSGVSCSCPTADTIGTREEATARTTASSLNGSRSSKLPPPRARTTTSTSGCAVSAASAATIARAAPFALDACLADDERVVAGKRAPNRRDEVAARGGVGPGEDPDSARDARERPLPLGREEALGREFPLQLLERDEVAAEPEPLDRASHGARARPSARRARRAPRRGRSRLRRARASSRS